MINLNLALNLLVLRCADIHLSKSFYEVLGFSFEKEKHGNGPEHYAACTDSGLVIELYPASTKFPVDHCRLGLNVFNVAEMAKTFNKAIEHRDNSSFFLLKDPDDRTIEITGKSSVH